MAKYRIKYDKTDIPDEVVEANRIEKCESGQVTLLKGRETVAVFNHPLSVLKIED